LPTSFEVRRPPNRRSRRAAKAAKPVPGTADCCPKCKSPRVNVHVDHGIGDFYGRQIAVCPNCRTAWEPIEEALIWDPSDPSASFINCAFRPGSPEQKDTGKWREMIAQLRAGGSFHCQKCVPLAPESESGFASRSTVPRSSGSAAATEPPLLQPAGGLWSHLHGASP
jgi:hypothetical protein